MAVNFEFKNMEKILSKIQWKAILFIMTFFSGFMLFLPDKILNKIFLLDLRNQIGVVLGITFIICVSIWFIIGFVFLVKKIKIKIAFSDKTIKKGMERLSKDAIELIVEMYHSDSYSMTLEFSNATVTILESFKYIGRNQVSICGLYFEYYLQPWLIKYLKKHISEYEES